MGNVWRGVSVALVAGGLAAPAAGAATTTKTAAKAPAVKKLTAADGVALKPGDFKIVMSVSCGRIGGVWRPGTVVKATGRFKTYTLQAATATKAAKTAKGAARKKQQKAAARYADLATRRLPICKIRPGRVPAGTATAVPTPAAPYVPYYPSPSYVTQSAPLRFDLKDAVGVATRAPVTTTRSATLRSTTTSNFAAVDTAGHLRDAIVSGSANVGQFLIGPDNSLYTLFGSATYLEANPTTTSRPCLLARVDRDTGVPTCIDDSLAGISWTTQYGNGNDAIQFDDHGGVYYMGTTYEGRTVLRRWSGGTRTDLVTDNSWNIDFVVLPSGTVILSGSTPSTGAQWLRRLRPSGELTTLKAQQSSFLRLFPDGNVYIGMSYWSSPGVLRYLADEDALDASPWIGPQPYYYYTSDGSTVAAPRNDISPFCNGNYNSPFCGGYGANVSKSFTTDDGQVYVLNGSSPNQQLMKYFPAVDQPSSTIFKITVGQGGASSIVLTGLDAHDKNVTTIYDTTAHQERTLIGPDKEIEVYHLNYEPGSDTVLFDGLRFADNTYVLGRLDTTTGELTATTPISSRFIGFQTFR